MIFDKSCCFNSWSVRVESTAKLLFLVMPSTMKRAQKRLDGWQYWWAPHHERRMEWVGTAIAGTYSFQPIHQVFSNTLEHILQWDGLSLLLDTDKWLQTIIHFSTGNFNQKSPEWLRTAQKSLHISIAGLSFDKNSVKLGLKLVVVYQSNALRTRITDVWMYCRNNNENQRVWDGRYNEKCY